jgi:hypothetical protein
MAYRTTSRPPHWEAILNLLLNLTATRPTCPPSAPWLTATEPLNVASLTPRPSTTSSRFERRSLSLERRDHLRTEIPRIGDAACNMSS